MIRMLAVAATLAVTGTFALTSANAEFYAAGPIKQGNMCQKNVGDYYGYMEPCAAPEKTAVKRKVSARMAPATRGEK